MKNLVVSIVFLSILGFGSAQNGCSKYYPMQEGAEFQITVYDKKDKPSGVLDYIVKDVSGDTATFFFEMRDEKGKLLASSEYGVTCKEDGVSIDFNSLITPGMLEQYKDMEVEMTGTDLELPNNLSPGQTLPDADFLMNIKMSPINMKMSSRFFNRKVAEKESLTTPAGTFDCHVITYDQESKMGIKFTGSSKQWLAEGIGMVKQESYNKKGELMGMSVLTKFKK